MVGDTDTRTGAHTDMAGKQARLGFPRILYGPVHTRIASPYLGPYPYGLPIRVWDSPYAHGQNTQDGTVKFERSFPIYIRIRGVWLLETSLYTMMYMYLFVESYLEIHRCQKVLPCLSNNLDQKFCTIIRCNARHGGAQGGANLIIILIRTKFTILVLILAYFELNLLHNFTFVIMDQLVFLQYCDIPASLISRVCSHY